MLAWRKVTALCFGGRAAVPVLMLLGAFVLPVSAQTDPPRRSGRIEGRVVSLEPQRPVASALVRLGGTPLFELTDEEGRFLFTSLEPGDYVLTVSASGFRDPRRTEVRVEAGSTAAVEVVLREQALELPSLVVTAARGAEGFGESTAGVDIVTAADIERRSALTVDQALRFASGVVFNEEQMDIRGTSGLARGVGSRVLVLVDGHRFLSGTTGGVAFDAIPIMGIERIEVVKGPSSTLYGSNAVGGVVNVIRKAIPERPETTIRAHLGAYDPPDDFSFTSEALNYQGLEVRHARRFGRVGVFAEGSRKTSDGYRQNEFYERNFVHGGFSVLREQGQPLVEAFALWSWQEAGEFFVWDDPDRPLEVAPEELGDYLVNDRIHVGVTATPISTEDVQVQIRGGIYRDQTENYFHDNDDYHISTRYSLDTQASLFQARGHVVTLGVEGALTPIEANILGTPELYDLALFAQEDFRLNQVFRATAGARVDYHDTDVGEAEFEFNPKLGIVFASSHGLSYRASVSKGYRAPSAVEQFVSSTQFGFRVVPNPELAGESAVTVEVGATGRVTEWVFVEGGLFLTTFEDLIGPAPVPGGDFGTFQFQNVAEAQVWGFDASARFGVVESLLRAQVNYLFLDTEDQRTGEPLPYRSAHNLTVSADYGPLGIDFGYRSRVERVLAYPLDPREAITLVGLRLGFRFGGVSGQLKLTNLLQETYVNIQERSMGPSRGLQFTVQTTL